MAALGGMITDVSCNFAVCGNMSIAWGRVHKMDIGENAPTCTHPTGVRKYSSKGKIGCNHMCEERYITLIKNIPISFRNRMKELRFDYLVVLLYLALLFGVTMAVYHLFFKGIPKMNETQSQLIALLTSVIPIILIFAYLDYAKDGSIGKRKASLKLVYKRKSFQSSVIRNVIKIFTMATRTYEYDSWNLY